MQDWALSTVLERGPWCRWRCPWCWSAVLDAGGAVHGAGMPSLGRGAVLGAGALPAAGSKEG